MPTRKRPAVLRRVVAPRACLKMHARANDALEVASSRFDVFRGNEGRRLLARHTLARQTRREICASVPSYPHRVLYDVRLGTDRDAPPPTVTLPVLLFGFLHSQEKNAFLRRRNVPCRK